MKRKLPRAFYNTTTMFGITVAGISLGLIFFLMAIDSFAKNQNPYVGLIAFTGIPPFFVLGLFIAILGVMKTHKKLKKATDPDRLPTVDFNNPRHRRAVATILYGGVFFFAISAFGSYQAYEYTESVEFCGTTCHVIMKPEYTAYQNSPHAMVPCVKCHIGPGAGWYVKSKLSGAYQVYSTIFHKYKTPIETPIANLRPAKDTCEQCHWPKQFYSQKLRDRTYYLSDDANSAHNLQMSWKIGGDERGASQGIHAHMYLDHEVRYIASDRQRQVIPYVEMTDGQGNVTVYRSTEEKITDAQIKGGEKRLVDCIDCHNRPSHQYKHPEETVNLAMGQGWVSPKLPGIKRIAVEALEGKYKTEAEGKAGIAAAVRNAYKEANPGVLTSMSKELDTAIKELQRIYGLNYFPEMGVSWKAFPNNLDHIHSAGCFRCHDGKHVSDKGKVITKDCNSCHTIISQPGPNGKPSVSATGQEFRHPGDVGDMWKDMLCKDCHGVQK